MRITKKVAALAAAQALAVPIMAAAHVSAAQAATPTVGIGVGGYPWYGSASAGRTGSGNLISNVGAGDREYIRVG